MAKDMKNLKLAVFSIVLGTVLLVFFLKGMFLMTRYGITATAKRCEKSATDNGTSVVESKVSHEFIFTTLMYGMLSVLRFLEYLLLGKQFYFFLFKQDSVNAREFFTKHSNRFWYILLFSVILFPYLCLGIVIPSLGIYQEITHAERIEECYRHFYEIYITYCAVNYFRYFIAYSVRIMMIFTVLSLSKFWFPEHKGPPRHTSVSHSKSINAIVSVENDGERNRVLVSDENDGERNDGNDEERNRALNDWKTVSSNYKYHAIAYKEVGKKVMEINELFQTWFIVPWMVYFIASSLKTYNILRPWNADDDGNAPPTDIPQIYYLLYNVNQFITLVIPYLCAKKINTYHQKYYNEMRRQQLEMFMESPSRLSFARQLMVEKQKKFDFIPRIIGTSITVDIGSPLYVVILLAGLFLSATKSLI